MELITSYMDKIGEFPVLFVFAFSITLIFIFLAKWITRIDALQVFFLISLGMLTFAIIKFFQFFNGSSESLNLFFFTIDITGNDFITSFQKLFDVDRLNGGSLTFSEKIRSIPFIGINLLAAILEEFGKMFMFTFFLFYHRSKVIRVIFGTILYLLLANSILSLLHNTFGNILPGQSISDTQVLGHVIMMTISILCIRYHHIYKGHLHVTNIAGSLFYMTFIAIGFSLFENMQYIQYRIIPTELSGDILLKHSLVRTIAGSISHVFFSIVFVYFYARGFFGLLAMIDQKTTKQIHNSFWFLKMLGIWSRSALATAYRVKMITIGALSSIGLHALYNIIQSGNNTKFSLFAILFVIVGSLAFYMMIVGEKKNRNHYSIIQEKINTGKELKKLKARIQKG